MLLLALSCLSGVAAAPDSDLLVRVESPEKRKPIYMHRSSSTADRSLTSPTWMLKLSDDTMPDDSWCRFTGCWCTAMTSLPVLLADCGDLEVGRLLDSRSELAFAEESASFSTSFEPDGPDDDNESADELPWNLKMIRLAESDTTGAGVRIFVVDCGVSATHEDLKGRVSYFTGISRSGRLKQCDGQDDEDCRDELGHGTFVAGVAAGTTFGVARNATVVSVKVCDRSSFRTAVVVEAFDLILASERRPGDIVNLSFGTVGNSRIMTAVLTKLRESGRHVFIAAGNMDDNACAGMYVRDKANFVVGASTESYRRAAFSNWGDCLDIFAPGVEIRSADVEDDSRYTSRSGTSFAAPHVAGAAALYLERNRDASPLEVFDFLAASAKWGALEELREGDPNRLLRIGPVIPEQLEEIKKKRSEDQAAQKSRAPGGGRRSAVLAAALAAAAPAAAAMLARTQRAPAR